MKKVLALVAVLALAGCGEKKAASPATDSTATMRQDSGMTMQGDSGMKVGDSTMARDTAKKM